MIDLTQKTISRLFSECLINLPLDNTLSKQPELLVSGTFYKNI